MGIIFLPKMVALILETGNGVVIQWFNVWEQTLGYSTASYPYCQYWDLINSNIPHCISMIISCRKRLIELTNPVNHFFCCVCYWPWKNINSHIFWTVFESFTPLGNLVPVNGTTSNCLLSISLISAVFTFLSWEF